MGETRRKFDQDIGAPDRLADPVRDQAAAQQHSCGHRLISHPFE